MQSKVLALAARGREVPLVRLLAGSLSWTATRRLPPPGALVSVVVIVISPLWSRRGCGRVSGGSRDGSHEPHELLFVQLTSRAHTGADVDTEGPHRTDRFGHVRSGQPAGEVDGDG